ncbi:hypothetical protein [Philodulcilactobacillus myokoensis]|nr:hypothetical protein [Philodulcilactobacillus myokoensis]
MDQQFGCSNWATVIIIFFVLLLWHPKIGLLFLIIVLLCVLLHIITHFRI